MTGGDGPLGLVELDVGLLVLKEGDPSLRLFVTGADLGLCTEGLHPIHRRDPVHITRHEIPAEKRLFWPDQKRVLIVVETYDVEELFTLFNLGYLQLKDRAVAEELFHRICRKALYFSSFERHTQEEFENLQKVMVSKYLANFSIFQSIPDSWSINQLFPVMPLSRHDEKPNLKATIVDITCDSDGCLTTFIDRADTKTVLELHPPSDSPYYIGFFLVGAYQESLANEHNLFGAIHEVEVYVNTEGEWEITKITQGDPIDELLVSRNYDMSEITKAYQAQLESAVGSGKMTPELKETVYEKLVNYTKGYPYLIEGVNP